MRVTNLSQEPPAEGLPEETPECIAAPKRRRFSPLAIGVEICALMLFIVFASLFAVITPRLGAPDEHGHVVYAKAIANGVMPTPSTITEERVIDGRVIYESAQAHHPPVFHALVAAGYVISGRDPQMIAPIGRGLSIIAGIAALLLLRAAAHRTFPDHPLVVAAGLAVVVASATFTYIMGSFNNEPLAVLMICLAIYLCARAMQSERPLRWIIALGVCLGAGLLVKLTTAVIVAPLVAAAVVTARREHAESADASEWRLTAAKYAGFALAMAALLSGPWFIRNQILFGVPTFNCADRPLMTSSLLIIFEWRAAGLLTALLLEELVAGYWWPEWLLRDYHTLLADLAFSEVTEVSRPLWLLLLLLLPPVLGVIGLRRLLHRQGSGDLDAPGRVMLLVLIALPVASVLGIIHQTLLGDAHIVRWPGRYAPGFIPPMGLVLALGLTALLPRRLHVVLAIVALLVAVHVNMSAAGRVVQFYQGWTGTHEEAAATEPGDSAVLGAQRGVHAADLPQVGDHRYAVGECAHPAVGGVDPADRHLDHLEAEAQGDEDQFGVEGPALEFLVREDGLDRLAGEHLEAALGVGDARAEYASLHDREHLPGGLAQEGLAHLEVRPLGGARADGEVRACLDGGAQISRVLDRG